MAKRALSSVGLSHSIQSDKRSKTDLDVTVLINNDNIISADGVETSAISATSSSSLYPPYSIHHY